MRAAVKYKEISLWTENSPTNCIDSIQFGTNTLYTDKKGGRPTKSITKSPSITCEYLLRFNKIHLFSGAVTGTAQILHLKHCIFMSLAVKHKEISLWGAQRNIKRSRFGGLREC